MAALDFSFTAGTLLKESFPRISVLDWCPVPPPSAAIGQSRMISPDVILGPQNFETILLNNTSDLTSSIIANLSEVFDYCSDSYNWALSTEANFQSTSEYDLGIFSSIRQHLDYGYHSHYQAPRRRLQDDIIESFLADHPVENDSSASDDDDQWIIFSAGCMGAGKTYTLRELSNHNLFSFDLKSFVSVDPDEIRTKLPEFEVYMKKDPLHAGEYTGKEAGMMAEILTEQALNHGNNVLVDGSLKNAKWHKAYFESLRRKYPQLKLGIIHVTAPLEDILLRVDHRARNTGRVIPMEVLMDSMEQVPKSVGILSQYADLVLEVDNSSGHGIRFPSLQGMESLNASFGRKIALQ